MIDNPQQRGKLKIFLGMAAGVGKTYAMLTAAQRQLAAGRDIVVGYVETHGRKETDALVEGLTVLPRRPIVYRGVTITEMDLDAILKRRPQLVLVDELAHTNAPGSRHPKRYQDVQELLDAGIHVYTTLNAQHVESRVDTVREITGAAMGETVPDSILDGAEIELVDLSPKDLIKRLGEGKVYIPERAEAAAKNFFREGNLIALREIALRLAADQAGLEVRDFMQSRQITGPWKTGHRLLVAISPSPFSEQMVRWTRRLADSFECSWIAVHVETSKVLSEEEQARLTRHLSLARELGAEVRTTTDDDMVRGLLRIAQAQNVTQIILGKPAFSYGLDFLRSNNILRRLVRESGNIDIHIVRANQTTKAKPPWLHGTITPQWSQYGIATAVVIGVTLINLLISSAIAFRSLGFIYLMMVVVLALFLGRGPIFFAATLSALLWDFLFLPPPYTFYIRSLDDAMMFGMYFIVALAMGQLIAKLSAKERMDRRREEHATAMYLLTLELADVSTWNDIGRVVEENVNRVFKAETQLLLPDAEGKLTGALDEKEMGAAQWAFAHNKPAGRFTDTLPAVGSMYIPLRTTGNVLGVLRLNWRQTHAPTLEQRSLMEGFLRHIALVIDRQRLHDMESRNREIAESERLGQALLNSISHEIRTPISVIRSATNSLQDKTVVATSGTQPLIHEIEEASERLNRLVGNILDMTRLESGHIKPRLDWCDLKEIVNTALQRVETEMNHHPVHFHFPSSIPLIRMDFALMEQVLVNLLMNVAMHTPPGTPVDMSVVIQERELSLMIADRGTGLPKELLGRIFEKFYRAPGAPSGGIGLGLSIVKGVVEAQGGRIEVENREKGGLNVILTWRLEEPPKI